MKIFLILGSINMALSIALGAFGAHGLKNRVEPDMVTIWETGAHYHMIHALALIVIGLWIGWLGEANSLLTTAGWLLVAGILLFSGSLYLLVVSNMKILGAITPIGGTAFIIGWILVTIVASKSAS